MSTLDEQEPPAETDAVQPLSSLDFEDETSGVDATDATSDDAPVYTAPTQEELQAASPAVLGFIPFLNLDIDELRKQYEERLRQLGPEKFLAQIAVAGSYESLLWYALQNYSAEAARTQTALTAIEDKDSLSYRLEKDGKIVLGPIMFRPKKSGETKMVSGESGMVAMLSARKGQIRRIPLYNSGFSIDVRNVNNDDLSTLFRRARAELDEYGREFGGHFYAYSDLLLKRAFFDTLLNLVIGSTLRDWKKPGVLMRNLALADYDVILTNIAALMYPDGYPDFRVLCTRPPDSEYPTGCDHITAVNANLIQLVLTAFGAMDDVVIQHMVKSRQTAEPIGPKELAAYHKALGFNDTKIVFDDYEFTMIVPSMADYFQAGELFNADLLNEMTADNRKGIYQAIAFREGRLFLPWIKSMASLDADGKPVDVTEDKAVISFILDTITTPDKDRVLIGKFTDFVNRSKLSHVCYKSYPCPKCGHEPKTPSGFVTVDPQHSFFILSTQKLIRSRS